jgi:hypothetical protein
MSRQAARTSADYPYRPKPAEVSPLVSGESEAMSNRETYQNKALACLEAAEKMSDPKERDAMVAVACDYMKLADQSRSAAAKTTKAGKRRQEGS